MVRSQSLQAFLDASLAAFRQAATDQRSVMSLETISRRMQTASAEYQGDGQRVPVCGLLDRMPVSEAAFPALRDMQVRFMDIEPRIRWTTKKKPDRSASHDFALSHANAMVVGPGGIEERDDVWMGATLMAPKTRYPDHTHAPEETYLAATPGEFTQTGGPWFSPGVGGSFYNPPGIVHAMRSDDDSPFLVFWALQLDQRLP